MTDWIAGALSGGVIVWFVQAWFTEKMIQDVLCGLHMKGYIDVHKLTNGQMGEVLEAGRKARREAKEKIR